MRKVSSNESEDSNHGQTLTRVSTQRALRSGARKLLRQNKPGSPGEVIESHGDTLVVACGDASALRLVEVQPEAKRRMVTRDFLNGTHLKVGDRFGQ